MPSRIAIHGLPDMSGATRRHNEHRPPMTVGAMIPAEIFQATWWNESGRRKASLFIKDGNYHPDREKNTLNFHMIEEGKRGDRLYTVVGPRLRKNLTEAYVQMRRADDPEWMVGEEKPADPTPAAAPQPSGRFAHLEAGEGGDVSQI